MPSAADLDVSSIVARTSRSYDELPYTPRPFPHTHPSLLGAIARLFGLDAAPPGSARVLELGCATGGNIIPLAARYPNASFMGVDLSSVHVASARARISHLGLSNIDIRCQNFSELDAAAPDAPFDYIVCHGVYSWVPAPLRETILRICREWLSPRGVALISYNVLPGWRMSQALRDCFLLHCSADADPRRRVAEARALMQFLPRACPETGPYRDFLAGRTADMLNWSDDHLAHEFLEEVNDPCSFRDFVDAAGRHRLTFLAEAELLSMIPANYSPDTAEMLQKIGANQLIATEQYIDMITGRLFRNSLLVATERAGRIDRALDPIRVEGMHFIGDSALTLTREQDRATLAAPVWRRMHTGSAALADALAQFVDAFPASFSVDDMVQALPVATRNLDGRAMVREALLYMVLSGLATPRLDAVPAVARPGPLPVACPMARAEAASGATNVVNLRHEPVDIRGLAQFVLPLLDGSRDGLALRAAVVDGARDGRLACSRDGAAVHDPAERERIAVDNLNALLPALASKALLLA